jgi:hypothetical protein
VLVMQAQMLQTM